MCGRYYIDADSAEMQKLTQLIAVESAERSELKTSEIYPTHTVPVITERKTVQAMTWGFPHFRNSGVIINARAETALDKRMFKEAMLSRRCAVISSGFYEWKVVGAKKKDKYYFTFEGSPLMLMAGLYTPFEKNGEKQNKFVILTTAANNSMESVHDRMPVILPKENMRRWLTDTHYALELLKQKPPMLDKAVVE